MYILRLRNERCSRCHLLSLWNSITILAFIVAHDVMSIALFNVCVYIPGAQVLVCNSLSI